MIFSQILKVIHDLEMSTGQLAPYIGISDMTLRRWFDKPNLEVPLLYENALREGIFQLIQERRVSVRTPLIREFLDGKFSNRFNAAVTELKIQGNIETFEGSVQEKTEAVLSLIGQSEENRREVGQQTAQIASLRDLGRDWKSGIDSLVEITRSKEISLSNKFVAYGALYYLISPMSLIPRSITALGYIDHFGMLCIAVSFYSRQLPIATKSVIQRSQ
jgi:uncharacterized membrane protein YkvA (DUF1232 family)